MHQEPRTATVHSCFSNNLNYKHFRKNRNYYATKKKELSDIEILSKDLGKPNSPNPILKLGNTEKKYSQNKPLGKCVRELTETKGIDKLKLVAFEEMTRHYKLIT